MAERQLNIGGAAGSFALLHHDHALPPLCRVVQRLAERIIGMAEPPPTSSQTLAPAGHDESGDSNCGLADQDRPTQSREDLGVIRLLIADDHPSMRQTLRFIFEQQEDMQVIGEAQDGRTAVEMACRYEPDVMVMDINMPRMTGIEAVRVIRRDMPSVRVVGLSVHRDPVIVSRMKEAGAAAYQVKGDSVEELCQTVRRVHRQRRDQASPCDDQNPQQP